MSAARDRATAQTAGTPTAGTPTAGSPTAQAGRPSSKSARGHSAPFHTTSRWLRGQILDHLRRAADGEWVALDGAIGEHDRAAVSVAAFALAHEGLLELDRAGQSPIRARLPIR